MNTGYRKIERASMDGMSRMILHSTGLSRPFTLTLDYDSHMLYWIDTNTRTLETSSIDGANRRILTRTNIACPYGLAYFNQKLYWGDTCYRNIYATSVSTPSSVSVLVSIGNTPYRIKVVAEGRQPLNGQFFLFIKHNEI